MKAVTAEGDRAMHIKIYDDYKRDLNVRRAVLEAQLAGTSKPDCITNMSDLFVCVSVCVLGGTALPSSLMC